MRGDGRRIADMLEAIERVREFTAGGPAAFYSDAKTHEAVAYEVLKLGEAASHISQSFRKDHPTVPWQRLGGLRHEIVHEYFRLELDGVWEFITREMPGLERQLRALPPAGV